MPFLEVSLLMAVAVLDLFRGINFFQYKECGRDCFNRSDFLLKCIFVTVYLKIRSKLEWSCDTLRLMENPTILIVDNEENQMEIASFLPAYQFKFASTLDEGVSIFEQHYLKIRAVLVNRNMDEKIEDLIKSFKTIFRDINIVVISKEPQIKTVVSIMKSGAFDFLNMPFSQDEVESVVSRAVENSLFHQIHHVFEEKEGYFDVMSLLNLHVLLSSDIPSIQKAHEEGGIVEKKDVLSIFDTGDFNSGLESFKKTIEKKLRELPQDLGKVRILIVEDEPIFRTMVMKFLQPSYEVTGVENGVQCLEEVQAHSYHIIFLDVFLPDQLGDELVSKIRNASQDTQIIMLTAYEQIETAVRSLKHGANDYLNKPVLKKDILAAVSRALSRRYMTFVFPEVLKELFSTVFSEDIKLDILMAYYQQRKEMCGTLTMKDIYIFFPELRSTYIPDEVKLPKDVLEKNLKTFVQDLRTKLKLNLSI